MNRGSAVRAGVVAALLALANGAAAQQLWYSGALDYAGGTYGLGERLESVQLITTLGLIGDRAGISLSVPLLYDPDGAVAIVGTMMRPGGGTPMPTSDEMRDRLRRGGRGEPIDEPRVVESRTAFGDPLAAGWLDVYQGYGILRAVALTGAVKPPVVDDVDGAGSGAWDGSAGASVTIGGERTFAFADAGYTWLGDAAAGPFRDGAYGSLGLARAVGADWVVAGDIAANRAGLPELETAVWLGAQASGRVSEHTRLSAGVSVGLSDAAADVTVFAGWRLRLSGS